MEVEPRPVVGAGMRSCEWPNAARLCECVYECACAGVCRRVRACMYMRVRNKVRGRSKCEISTCAGGMGRMGKRALESSSRPGGSDRRLFEVQQLRGKARGASQAYIHGRTGGQKGVGGAVEGNCQKGVRPEMIMRRDEGTCEYNPWRRERVRE